MMKNIAVSAATVAVCASTTGVMAMQKGTSEVAPPAAQPAAGAEPVTKKKAKKGKGEKKANTGVSAGKKKAVKKSKGAVQNGAQGAADDLASPESKGDANKKTWRLSMPRWRSSSNAKPDEVSGEKPATAPEPEDTRTQEQKMIDEDVKGNKVSRHIIQSAETQPFALVPVSKYGETTYHKGSPMAKYYAVLENNNGHFLNGATGKYYRFQTVDANAAVADSKNDTEEAGQKADEAEKESAVMPPKFELQVREAPTLSNMWRVLSNDTWTPVSADFHTGATQVIANLGDAKQSFTEGGNEETRDVTNVALLRHEPRTYTASFLQIFFGFQQSWISAICKMIVWAGAIYAALHFTVLKRAAVSDDEEEGTSCMSDSEEGESDSDVEDLESNLGESIRSGSVRASQASVRSGSARASAAASVRSGSVKSSQA